MKLLLDENLPKRLKQDFPDHDVYTVRDMEWNGIKNGQLLTLMVETALKYCSHSTKIYNISKISGNIL